MTRATIRVGVRCLVEAALLSKHAANTDFVDGIYKSGNEQILKAFQAEVIEGIFRKLKGETRWVNLARSLAVKGYTHSRLRDRKDAAPWQPATKDPKGIMRLFKLAVALSESPMPAEFEGTKYPPADLTGLSAHLLEVFDATEREETKGLSKAERNALAKSASQLLEPFCARLLGQLEPKLLLERMAHFMEEKKEGQIGIGMLHQLLRETKRAPLNEASFKLNPKDTDGWERLDTFSNAIRDLVALRLKAAHKSPDLLPEESGQAAWCAVVVVLGLVEHNVAALRQAFGEPPSCEQCGGPLDLGVCPACTAAARVG